MLLDMLPEAIAKGRRVLLFSAFTSMLKILRRELEDAGYETMYLDGDAPAQRRVEMAEQFNAGQGQIFLISLKAGGTGLNLTGADMVIHYDPWWNPAAEDQATDRAYRIGQTRKVEVIRLVTHASIEEQVVALGQRKKALFDQLIKPGESMVGGLSPAGDYVLVPIRKGRKGQKPRKGTIWEVRSSRAAKKGQGEMPLAGSRGGAPLWGFGQRPNCSTGDQYAKEAAQQRCRQRSVPASNFARPQTRPQAALSNICAHVSRQMGATDVAGLTNQSCSFAQAGVSRSAERDQRAMKTDEVCDRPLETFGSPLPELTFIVAGEIRACGRESCHHCLAMGRKPTPMDAKITRIVTKR